MPYFLVNFFLLGPALLRDIVETFFYGGEWGVKTPMQQRTTA